MSFRPRVFLVLILLLYEFVARETAASADNHSMMNSSLVSPSENATNDTVCSPILRKTTCLQTDTCVWKKKNSTDPRCAKKSFSRQFKRTCANFVCMQLLNETNGGNKSNSSNKSFYNIRLVYHPSTPDKVKPVFEAARLKWQSIIIGDLGDSIHLVEGDQGCPGITWTKVNAKEG